MKKYSQGFTIIELIVVIAVIAVLATIVSVNVVSYVNKSKDAAIKANMSQMNSAATKYFEANGTYNGFCGTDWCDNNIHQCSGVGGSDEFKKIANAVVAGGATFACMSDPGYQSVDICSKNQWVAWVISPRNSITTWCIDYTGFKGKFTQQWNYCACNNVEEEGGEDEEENCTGGCGDGCCDIGNYENCSFCPSDCGECTSSEGDGICAGFEQNETCQNSSDCACDNQQCFNCENMQCQNTCDQYSCQVCNGNGSCVSSCDPDQYCENGECVQNPL